MSRRNRIHYELSAFFCITIWKWILFDDEKVAKQFTDEMLKNGVILRGLKGFGLPHCVRVTIGTIEENKYFIQILNKIMRK